MILRLNVKYPRLLLASLAGGALSLLSLLSVPFAVNLLFKTAGAATVALVAFGYKSARQFIRAAATLFIITFLFSGAMICLYLALKPRGMAIINDTLYFDISPPLLIILTLIIYFILILYRRLFKNRVASSRLYEVNILAENNNYKVMCKADSGMNVKEPFSGSRVIIAERSQFEGLKIPENKLRAIPFKSLGGSGVIYGFKPDSLTVDGKTPTEEIYIGLCDNILKSEAKGLIPDNIGECI